MELPLSSGTLLIAACAALGVLLPLVGLVLPIVPHLLALPVALLKRDPHGPFVPRQRARAALTAGLVCLLTGALLLVAIQPRFFRPGRATASPASTLRPSGEAMRGSVGPEVDAMLAPLPCAGVVVGIVQPGGSDVLGFGRVSPASDAVPDGRTIFEIGTLTKAFTGSLLVRLAERGVVQMEQPVQSLLPDSVSVPMFDGQSIELRHLAIGCSGLPRSADPAWPVLEALPPFSRVTLPRSTKRLHQAISSMDVAQRPGTSFDDSDFGRGLLGHALARAAHADYDTLFQRELCHPLGLKDTRVRLTDDMRKRLSPGMAMGWGTWKGWRVASPTPRWFSALPGADGLHSTANDLIVFLWANLGLHSTELTSALSEAQAVRLQVIGQPHAALAWRVETLPDGDAIVWQRGEAGASRSWVGFVRSRGVGVVVLANSAIDADRLGRSVLARLLGPSV